MPKLRYSQQKICITVLELAIYLPHHSFAGYEFYLQRVSYLSSFCNCANETNANAPADISSNTNLTEIYSTCSILTLLAKQQKPVKILLHFLQNRLNLVFAEN